MRRSRLAWRLYGGTALVFAAFLAASTLVAQPDSALRDYREGEDLYERGDLTGALRAFERAYAADHGSHRGERIGMHFEDYDPAFQLGRVHARLGNFEQAQRYFAECAASGYTERSQNASEFVRWRSVVDRALALARTRPAPTSTPPPAAGSPSPASAPAPAPAAAAEHRPIPTSPPVAAQVPPSAPTAAFSIRTSTRTAPPTSPTPPASPPPAVTAPAAAPIAPGGPSGTPPASATRDLARRAPARPGRAGDGRGTIVAAAALLLLAAGAVTLVVARRIRRPRPGNESTVSFGRYAISGFLGGGPSSFVYEAIDRKTRAPVALRIRRPDAPPELADRFRREVEALERLQRLEDRPAPRLIERGARTISGRTLDFAALERLGGRTLLDLSRNARRRLDPPLCVAILRSILRRLDEAHAAGLAHEELTAQDILLIEPIPVTADREIELKILGLTEGEPGAGETRGLISIALELFRGRARTWDDESSMPEHVPLRLRELLLRAASDPAPTLEEFLTALGSCGSQADGAARA